LLSFFLQPSFENKNARLLDGGELVARQPQR
jgi:hypothetical protein